MKHLPLLLVLLASCNEASHLQEGGSTETSANTTYSTASEVASSDAQPKETESPIAETSEEALPSEIAVNPVPVAGAYLSCSPRPDQGDLSCIAESTDEGNEDFHFVAKSAYIMLGDSNLWTELSFECDLEKSNSWFLKLPPESLTASYAIILRSEESGVLATWTINPAVEPGNLVADGGFEGNGTVLP